MMKQLFIFPFSKVNKEKVLFKLFSSNILQKKNIAKKNSSML